MPASRGALLLPSTSLKALRDLAGHHKARHAVVAAFPFELRDQARYRFEPARPWTAFAIASVWAFSWREGSVVAPFDSGCS